MRVIPVIDLKSGAAVHAVRGERERYRPLRSEIVAGSDPIRAARALRRALGLDEL
jgi:phosphoribosylformimino-5-aminoimidazole carboxamide ribotide isomerase